MTNDAYLRVVLTVIAAALVYLCVLLTPLPTVFAQPGRVVGAPTPGVSTGPAEMVVVGWRAPEQVPVSVTRGEVRVTNDTIRVNGRVQTEPLANTTQRTLLVGWEEGAGQQTRGTFQPFFEPQSQGLPVSIRPQKP